jgi:hypothetical protein
LRLIAGGLQVAISCVKPAVAELPSTVAKRSVTTAGSPSPFPLAGSAIVYQ